MKLKEYLENLNQIVKDHPSALECDVIYASDDVSTGWVPIYSSKPALGDYRPASDDFYSLYDIYNMGMPMTAVNAICIN